MLSLISLVLFIMTVLLFSQVCADGNWFEILFIGPEIFGYSI